MKNSILSLFTIAALLLLQSCNMEFSSASIDNLQTCHQLEGNLCDQSVDVFHPNSPQIVSSCQLHYAPPETIVTFTWKYIEGTEDIIIDAVSMNTGNEGSDLELHSSLSRPNNGWPAGRYAVDIIIGEDKSSLQTIEFEVR